MELTRFDLQNQNIQRRIATALERIATALEKSMDAVEKRDPPEEKA
jgi:hypothetical protein